VVRKVGAPPKVEENFGMFSSGNPQIERKASKKKGISHRRWFIKFRDQFSITRQILHRSKNVVPASTIGSIFCVGDRGRKRRREDTDQIRRVIRRRW